MKHIVYDNLSLLDIVMATVFKSPQQRLCERYASANPEHHEIQIRRWDVWEVFDCCPYRVEIWNKTKYNGRYVHTNGDIEFGVGLTIADAFSDLLRNIVAYERISEKTVFRNNFRVLLKRIRKWEDDEREQEIPNNGE